MKNKMSAERQEIINEKHLQRLIRRALRDSLTEWRTTSGALLSVLSVGEWNHNEGPDFLNMALQVEGKIIVGHGEVHWRSSDWEQHNHDAQPLYRGLALHIVLHDNRASTPFARYTLVMPEKILLENMASEPDSSQSMTQNNFDGALCDYAELRDYATQRFLRKAQYASAVLAMYDLRAAFIRLLDDFVQRRLGKKHLPKGIKSIALAVQNPEHPAIAPFLDSVHTLAVTDGHGTTMQFAKLLETAECGRGTASEILVNIVLPLAYAHCEILQQTKAAQSLLRSFWQIPAANQYAHLKRKFLQIPQQYVWQQQGLLEYEAETGAPAKRSRERIQAVAAHKTSEMIITFYAA